MAAKKAATTSRKQASKNVSKKSTQQENVSKKAEESNTSQDMGQQAAHVDDSVKKTNHDGHKDGSISK